MIRQVLEGTYKGAGSERRQRKTAEGWLKPEHRDWGVRLARALLYNARGMTACRGGGNGLTLTFLLQG